jgi:hypothetical protein
MVGDAGYQYCSFFRTGVQSGGNGRVTLAKLVGTLLVQFHGQAVLKLVRLYKEGG